MKFSCFIESMATTFDDKVRVVIVPPIAVCEHKITLLVPRPELLDWLPGRTVYIETGTQDGRK